MDILKEFENYLPKWSEEKHLPIPTKQQADRWNVAWSDFVKDFLNPNYKELAQEYKNMQLKPKDYVETVEEEEEEEQIEEPVQEQLSDWELVQKFMNE